MRNGGRCRRQRCAVVEQPLVFLVFSRHGSFSYGAAISLSTRAAHSAASATWLSSWRSSKAASLFSEPGGAEYAFGPVAGGHFSRAHRGLGAGRNLADLGPIVQHVM